MLLESSPGPAARSLQNERGPLVLSAHLAAIRPVIRAVVARTTHLPLSHPDVDEAVAETLRRVVEGADRVRPGEPIGPWAAGVARHVALDYLRARRRERSRLPHGQNGGEGPASPMRSIALGVVGLIGGIAALVIIALTVVGIPFAFIGAIAAVVLAFAGTTSAAIVVGAMIAGHKSQNVYVHLAVGCGLFMLAGLLPWVGGWVQAAIVFAGIGGMVATKAMGFLAKKPKPTFPNPLPYR